MPDSVILVLVRKFEPYEPYEGRSRWQTCLTLSGLTRKGQGTRQIVLFFVGKKVSLLRENTVTSLCDVRFRFRVR